MWPSASVLVTSVGRRRGARRHAAGAMTQDAQHEGQFHQHDQPDDAADWQVVQHALAQFHEIDVEHHDDEEEQHGDGADIDDDEDHGEELGPQQDEEAGGVEEAEDEEQHRMNRVARRDHHHGRGHGDGREEIEEECGDHGALLTGRARRARCCARFRVPSGRRWRAASPC